MKRKRITIDIMEQDLACLRWMSANFPKTMDASTAMTLGSASMLVERITNVWNETKEVKRVPLPRQTKS